MATRYFAVNAPNIEETLLDIHYRAAVASQKVRQPWYDMFTVDGVKPQLLVITTTSFVDDVVGLSIPYSAPIPEGFYQHREYSNATHKRVVTPYRNIKRKRNPVIDLLWPKELQNYKVPFSELNTLLGIDVGYVFFNGQPRICVAGAKVVLLVSEQLPPYLESNPSDFTELTLGEFKTMLEDTTTTRTTASGVPIQAGPPEGWVYPTVTAEINQA